MEDLRIGVALSGGSAWGVAHVGALAALLKYDIPIHYIAGTSAGSVAAAPFAFGIPIGTIEEAAKKLEWKRLTKFAYSRLGVRNNIGLGSIIRGLVGDAKIEEAKIPLAIVATDIEKREKKVFYEGDVARAVCASSAIPGYFAPVEIDGTLYVDGGIAENLPLSPLRDMGAEFVIGVNLAGAVTPSRPKNLGEIMERSFDVLFRTRDSDAHLKADTLIVPEVASFHPRSFAEAEAIYQEGFRATEAAVPGIKAKLAIKRAARSTFFKRVRGYFNA